MSELGRTIRDIALERGLTIAALSEQCNVSETQMWVLMQGRFKVRGPWAMTLYQIEKGLGIQRGSLFMALCRDFDRGLK